ncbi:hypothetical protein N7478_010303 [Penicillium angulare]|uniref:uncharacterized protein n=1 Tax=Penicillium angulare TaxID=116970 RepID=UPI002541DA0C|nr:uncharacterized protein N7478_010303 [Penicillium angulare]KAJ5267495.1 hypothetical protein N7478_010303 [Penicillium angulare]
MQLPEPHKIQFINIAHPEQNASANKRERKAAYSHASRAAHARVRRLRTKQYQAAKHRYSAAPEEGEQNNNQYCLLPDAKVSESAKLTAQPRSLFGHPPAGRRDPFASLAVIPFQSVDYLLLDHYVTTVVPYLKTHCKKLQARSSLVDAMIMDWVQLALTEKGFLSSILLTSSRHLSYCYRHNSFKQHIFSQLAIRHKLTCVQTISGRIANVGDKSPFSDSIVAQVMVLALDEVSLVFTDFPYIADSDS